MCQASKLFTPNNSFNPHNGSYAIGSSVVLHFKGKEMEGQRKQGNWPKTQSVLAELGLVVWQMTSAPNKGGLPE